MRRKLIPLQTASSEHFTDKDIYVLERGTIYEVPAIPVEMLEHIKTHPGHFYIGATSVLLPPHLLPSLSILIKKFHQLRDFLMNTDPELASELSFASQILHWDGSSLFCGRCGQAQEWHASELAKHCPSCESSNYPQIQPVAIVLVHRGKELLLAKGPEPRKHHSCIAGFIELGETAEQTVAREVLEETGIKIQNVKYFGSQAWPFPNNLMLAFTAEWKSGEIQVDPQELSEAKWFTPENPPPLLPPPISIARQMIDSIWGATASGLELR